MAEYNYTWQEIVNYYHSFVKGEAKDNTMNYIMKIKDSFMGCSHEQVLKYLSEGYTFPPMEDESILPSVVDGEANRWEWTDDPEGAEYSYEMDKAGEMDYYLRRRQEKNKLGIRMRVNINFQSAVEPATIAEFGQWLGSVISAMESRGYDLELTFFSTDRGAIRGETTTTANIRVSNFGEIVILKDFSAYFAPGGWRRLNFMTCALPGELYGKKVNSSLGTAMGSQFAITWDADSRTMLIDCNANSRSIPFDKLNSDLKDIQSLIS